MTTTTTAPGERTSSPDGPPAARGATGWTPSARPRRRAAGHPRRLGDWPRTTRILPWLIAGYIALLWLVPFDTISLTVNLPFELKLDRIVLPVIAAVWLVALVVGGRDRPRIRMTPIHLALGTYVVVALLSVIVNVSWLNRQLLLGASIKQLVLLLSYATFFVIVASSVRPTEVRAFARYSLVLALICAVGTLWELRYHQNFFYQWTHALLPGGVFSAPLPDPTAVDELGRPLTIGPTEAPLELATIIATALPLAVVGLMRARGRRNGVLYLIACALLIAAGLATYRKSSLVLPAVLLMLLIGFRPRASLRLIPLGVVLFGVVHVLAPGVIGSVVNELSPSRLAAVGTTTHRTTGYEAIRPLVWSRPAFGQGFGSYNANVLRILDSQVLMSLIETGVLGLLAYLGAMVTTLMTARRIFHRRFGEEAWLALGLGVGSVAFLASSFLYDALSFPHAPYVFLSFAALIAVMYGERHGQPRAPGPQAPGATNRAPSTEPAGR